MRKFVLLLLAVMISSMVFALSSSAVTSNFATETRDGDPPSAVTAVVSNFNDVAISWSDPGFIWNQADPLGDTNGKCAQDFEAANNTYDAEIAADFVLADEATITGMMMAYFFTIATVEGIPSTPVPYNINIYSDVEGVPSVDPIHSTLSSATLPTEDNAWSTVDFNETVTLAAGTYWIGVSARQDFGTENIQCYALGRTGSENGTFAYWINPGMAFPDATGEWEEQDNDLSYALKGSYSTGRQLTGFKVYRDGVDVSGEVAAYTFEDTDLDAGTYEYTVTSIDDVLGESTPSPALSVEVLLPAPTNLTVTPAGANYIIRWEAPVMAGRSLLNYTLYRNGEILQENISGIFHVDTTAPAGVVEYFVVANYSGGYASEPSDTESTYGENEDINASTTLIGNYPNPFNPVTNISYSIKEKGTVTIDIYNIKGRLVKNLVNDVKSAGSHKETWTGINNAGQEVGSGIYFYKMRTNTTSATKKMILMK